MIAWWEAMTLIEQIFAVVGIASTVLLVIEVILLLVGVGHDADANMDAPGDAHADMGGMHDGIPHTDVHIGEITADGAADIDVSMDTDAPPGAPRTADIPTLKAAACTSSRCRAWSHSLRYSAGLACCYLNQTYCPLPA